MKNEIRSANFLRDNSRQAAAFTAGMVFLLVSLAVTRQYFNFLWLLPLSLAMLLMAFISLEKFLILTVFLVPLSIQLRFIFPGIPSDIFLPTELMLPVILALVVFRVISASEFNRGLLSHPVTVIILCMLGWGFVTSVTSTMPLVSFKSLLARAWFIAAFYLLAARVFSRRQSAINYFRAYIAGMIPVVIWFIYRMWQDGLFIRKASYSAVRPFFNDHTIIGASLAFCIPVIVYLLFSKSTRGLHRFILLLLLVLFSFAFFLSFSRAAWLSLAVAVIFAVVVSMRISWKIILPASAMIAAGVVLSWSSLMLRLGENRQDSSAEFQKHIGSISNITTDASNLERINRWRSALRMSAEKPLLGWGPSTYQFNYAPYQAASEKTIISTNWGEGGNAHSEYLSALVDSGVPGLILYILLLITVFYRGIKAYNSLNDRPMANLMLVFLTGLATYAVHGFLNNFLDTDKISALFWGMIAAVVALDNMRGRTGEKDFQ